MIEADENKFHEKILENKTPTVVMFYTNYCYFCGKFKPIFKEYSNSSKYHLTEVDITDDDNPLWDKFGIDAVPTVIAFKDGKILGRRDAEHGIGITESKFQSLINLI